MNSGGWLRKKACSVTPAAWLQCKQQSEQPAASASHLPESRAVLTADTEAVSLPQFPFFFNFTSTIFFTVLACWWNLQVASRWMDEETNGQMDAMPPATQRQVASTASKVERLLASPA